MNPSGSPAMPIRDNPDASFSAAPDAAESSGQAGTRAGLGAHWLGLQGQAVAVTGAASGIGAAIAVALAVAGARLALIDRDAAALDALAQRLSLPGADVLALPCDVADEDAVQRAARQVEARFGVCAALVNNAGLLRAGPLESVSLHDWNAVLTVNLGGYLLCARAFGAAMLAAGRGALVHVASVAGAHPQTGSGAYSASKAGVRLLSRQLAAEWGPRGLRSNVVSPGMIRTPLSARFYEDPGLAARRSAVTASRRIGEPADVADAVLFLASPRAAYVNGAELLVDGGLGCMLMDMVPRPGFNRTGSDGAIVASTPEERA